MAIADRINEMYTHVGNVYDTLEIGGAQIYTLPNEFTQVDYIESSGTQYIDTGFEANYNTRVVIDFIANQRSDAWLLGSRISYGESNYSVLLWNGGNLRTDYNTGGQDMGTSINTRYILDKNKNVSTLYQDGTQVSQITATYGVFNPNHNMYLFACNNNGSVSAMANVKMFSCKIYDNGTLIRDFIPCYRNSDNVIGLYDIVEGNFYTNKGTGAFTYGGVPREHIDKNIININAQLKDRLIDYMNNGTDKIWNNWEKVTGEGETLTLNSTEKAPMKINLKGNTSQEGTPTPETPQDIHVVSGDNTIEVCGKNLNNGIDYKFYISGSGTDFRVSGGDAGLCIKIDGTSSYTISTTTTQTRYRVACSNLLPSTTSQACYNGVVNDGTNNNITINTNGYKYLLVNATDLSAIQIEKGSTATTYEPYQGNTYNIDLPVENLLQLPNGSKTTNGITATITNGKLKIVGTTTTNWFSICDLNIPLESGTYTFSYTNKKVNRYNLNIKYADNTTQVIYGNAYSNTPITLNQKATITAMFSDNNTTGTTFDYEDYLMIEKGSKANSYTPYGTTPIELCKIGDYQDSIVKGNGKWYLNKQIGKVVFDGSENWTINTSYTYNVFYRTLDNYARISNTQTTYCEYYKGIENTAGIVDFGNNYNNSIGVRTANDNIKNIYISNNSITSASDFKTWLSTHNTDVYYVLANPTYTEITDTTLLSQLEALNGAKSYTTQTNISQENNDLPFILDVTALKELTQ